MLIPRENPFYWRLRGGSNPCRCIRQDSDPNTLPTQLLRPQVVIQLLSQLLVESLPKPASRIPAICTSAKCVVESGEAKGKVFISTDSLSTLQPLSRADLYQMIQARPALLPCQTDSSDPSNLPVGSCSSGSDREWNSRQACKNWQPGSKGKKPSSTQVKTLFHQRQQRQLEHLNWFRDWSWPKQTLVLRLHTGSVVWMLFRKESAFLTLLYVSAIKQTKHDDIPQSCTKYAHRHQQTWLHGADLVAKLWSSAEDLTRKPAFVASNRLKIWPAQLPATEEDEEADNL